MTTPKKQTKKEKARVDSLCSRAINRIQISLWDLGKISQKMNEALGKGLDEEKAVEEVRQFALTIGTLSAV